MLHQFDNQDCIFHYEQVRNSGMIPKQLVFKRATFERGGSLSLDMAYDAPVIGEIGFSFKLVVKLLSDMKTIRFRLIDTELIGVTLRSIAIKLLRKAIESMVIPGAAVGSTRALKFPGVTAVDDGKDIYFEYRPPEYVMLHDIHTNDNKFTVLQSINIPLMMEAFAAAKVATLNSSSSMADKAMAAKLQATTVERDKSGATVIYKAPNITGDINLAARI